MNRAHVPLPPATRRIVWVLLLMTFLLVSGTIGFRWVEGWSTLDSFYMTLMTLTTVGYGEVHPLSRDGQIVASVLMLTGVAAVFVSIGIVVDLIVRLELADYFGRRRRDRIMEQMRDHYIVCGAGRVGRSVIGELKRSGVPIILIDSNPERLKWAQEEGLPVLEADATLDETLTRANIDTACGLVAATSSDAQNVYVTLSARVLNPSLVISARATDEEAAEKLRRAGASTVLTPYTFIGHRLAQSMLRPHVLNFFDVTSALTGGAELAIEIEQVHIGEGSPLVEQTLEESRIRQSYGIIVLAIKNALGMSFNPPGDTRMKIGDVLIAMGDRPRLKRLEDEMKITLARV